MNSRLLKKCVEVSYTLYPSVVWHRSTHFAFLVLKNRIAYVGWNKAHTHPEVLRHPYKPTATIHAELDVCLKPKSDDLSSYGMVVVRIDRNNLINSSKPCKGCDSVIRQLGIQSTYFSTLTGEFELLN